MHINNKNILVCWIGQNDLDASQGKVSTPGPIGQTVEHERFAELHLLYNYEEKECRNYRQWLAKKTKAQITLHRADLDHPMHFQQIYEKAQEVIDILLTDKKNAALTFHLSPGTSAMAAVWIILGKVHVKAVTGEPARLLYSSVKDGVHEANIPFDLAVFKHAIRRLYDLPLPDGFIAHDKTMEPVLARLRKIAPWDIITVLITGETGTGKERFAKLIHDWTWADKGMKKDRPFVAVNCAAIPEDLFESELFGATKGAYTGADRDREGKFQAADGGTLFMDEIGELSLAAQAKVLRAIQEKKVTRVGDNKDIKVKVRIVAATNRDLKEEVAKGKFREDLYYRLAEAALHIPSLRERKEDILPLAEAQLALINRTGSESILDYRTKQFSPELSDSW